MTSAIPLINIEQIVAMAGETTFAKGILLAKAGSVHQLTWQDNSVSARVTGSHEYQVRLHLEGGTIACSCSCPAATYQVMCKHAVATAIALAMLVIAFVTLFSINMIQVHQARRVQ